MALVGCPWSSLLPAGVALGVLLSSGSGAPITSVIGGQRVFRITFPKCPPNISCPAEVRIGRTPYQYPNSILRAEYRSGPLYGVGSDVEARIIPALS